MRGRKTKLYILFVNEKHSMMKQKARQIRIQLKTLFHLAVRESKVEKLESWHDRNRIYIYIYIYTYIYIYIYICIYLYICIYTNLHIFGIIYISNFSFYVLVHFRLSFMLKLKFSISNLIFPSFINT